MDVKKGHLLAGIIFVFISMFYATDTNALSAEEFLASLNYSIRFISLNVTNYTDFMSDLDGNSINDTFSINITFNSSTGNYTIYTDLNVNNSIIINSVNRTSFNPNIIVINYSTKTFEGSRFNYSIRIYDSNLSLKYRETGILTNIYNNYQLAYKIINISDSNFDNNSIFINITLNITDNISIDSTVYLRHNKTSITARKADNLTIGLKDLGFIFDNGTIKDTHYIGNFTLYQLKINGKSYSFNYSTRLYDYRDFAKTSYVYNATDIGIDLDNNGLYDILRLNFSINILSDDTYKLQITIYDLYFNYIKQITKSQPFNQGINYFVIDVNGTDIYKRKLTGPYLVYPRLKIGNIIIDSPNRHITKQYNFTQFEKSQSPELFVNISTSNYHLFGIRNTSINITIGNNGSTRAYNLFLDVFDNYSFSQTFFISTLFVNSTKIYSFNFSNISDLSFTAIADLNNIIEEINESDNSLEKIIKVNRAPSITGITPSNNPNITENEQKLFSINYSDDDNISFTWLLNGSFKLSNSTNYTFIGNLSNAGTYNVTVNISDGYLHNSSSWLLTVIDFEPSTSLAPSASSTASTADGGCIIIYKCTDWQLCINGKQTRSCNVTRDCGIKIATERACVSSSELSGTESSENSAPVFVLSNGNRIVENENIEGSIIAPQKTSSQSITGAFALENLTKPDTLAIIISGIAVLGIGFYLIYIKFF